MWQGWASAKPTMAWISFPRPQDLLVQVWDGSEYSYSWRRASVKITSCCSIFILPQWFPCQTCSVYQSKQDISTCQLCQLSLGSGNQAVLSLLWTSSPAKKILKSRLSWMWFWLCMNIICFQVVLWALCDREQQGSCAVQALTNKSSPLAVGWWATARSILHLGDTKRGRLVGYDTENPWQCKG